jgi:DNA-binding Xre family transcriptional regulator
MNYKGVSSQKLSSSSGVSLSTINALRYGARDINKLEAGLLLKLANSLRVKVESLLADINLIFDVT